MEAEQTGFGEARVKDRLATVLLALFAGALGVHRFYLGQWWGVFYILFIWTGIPSLVALIEAIIFAFTSQSVWDERHNRGAVTAPAKGSGAIIAVVVIAGLILVIGVLAAIAIPQMSLYRAKAFCAAVKSDVANAAKAQEVYYIDNGIYSQTTYDLPGFHPSSGVQVEVEVANDMGYILTGSHGSCVDASGSPQVTVWDSTRGGLQ